MTDPRIEAIRRAFEEARFDERTPDEKGFAEVFETELKPKLIEDIGPALKRELARRKVSARIIAGCAGVIAILAVISALTIAGKDASSVVNVLAVMALVFTAWMGLAFHFAGSIFGRSFTAFLTFFVGKGERSLVRTFAIETVLRRFGCRLGTSDMSALMSSPIRPRWNQVVLQPIAIEGAFDGRLDFTAMRLTAFRQDGKERKTAFHGWHVVIELPFSFNGTTTVRDRQASVEYAGGKEMRELALEDPEFTRQFVAQTDDQVEARVIFSPDVIHHVATLGRGMDRGEGHLLMAFAGSRAHVWLPWEDTALSDWQPLHPPKLIEDLHEAFAELAEIRAFLRDIDVIAESEGFRAQAAKNGRAA